MGRNDINTKEYMEDPHVFANVFKHMIYTEKVIDPKNLKELDTVNVTGIVVCLHKCRVKFLIVFYKTY